MINCEDCDEVDAFTENRSRIAQQFNFRGKNEVIFVANGHKMYMKRASLPQDGHINIRKRINGFRQRISHEKL
jgi:hypothetical protein